VRLIAGRVWPRVARGGLLGKARRGNWGSRENVVSLRVSMAWGKAPLLNRWVGGSPVGDPGGGDPLGRFFGGHLEGGNWGWGFCKGDGGERTASGRLSGDDRRVFVQFKGVGG